MPDLGVLEILIAFFLFLPLTENYIKTFRYVTGFAFLPPIAFFCTLAIFPAYGFRPECVPLLIWTIIYNSINFHKLVPLLTGRDFSDYSGGRNIFALTALLVTAAASGAALYFLPETSPHEFNFDSSFSNADAESRNYFINLYNVQNAGIDAETPLVIVVPPLLGSVSIVDGICAKLGERGVRLVSFSRENLDIPARGRLRENKEIKARYPKIAILKKYLISMNSAWKNKSALEAARFFEQERMRDIEFILPLAARQFNSRNIYIAAYNEGASAAIILSAREDFIASHPELKGVIAIEGRMWTDYTIEEGEDAGAASRENLITQLIKRMNIKNFFYRNKKPAPAAPKTITPPRLPLLLLNADRISNKKTGWWTAAQGPYAAIEVLIDSRGGSIQSQTIAGAGADDYSDVPEKYPVISFFTRSASKRAAGNKNKGAAAINLIYNFIEGVSDASYNN